MNRRNFLSATAASGLAAGAAAAKEMSNQYFELRSYQVRNSKADQRQRLSDFMEKHHLPLAKRLELPAVGYFQVYLGPNMPRIVTLTAYNSLADMQSKMDAMAADKAWKKAADEFGAADEPAFDRVESWLLKAFDGMPKLEVPSLEGRDGLRFFDLRTYEAETFSDSREKVNMFNSSEIAIFRRSGINPVFFGQTIVGSKMPSLTYMVWYEDLPDRATAWGKFLSDPEWKKIRVKPGWSDAEIVSNISNTFLQPLPFSPIR